jgi:DNA-binding phage protein
MSARTNSQEDLLRLSAASLQAALLKTGDDQLRQALRVALPLVRSAILEGLSARRRARIQEELDQPDNLRGASSRSSSAAMLGLLSQIFGESALPEPVQLGVNPCSGVTNGRTLREATCVGATGPLADLSRDAFELLKTARGIVGAFTGFSEYARHVATCRSAMTGAVLLKAWLRRPAQLSREAIYRNLCAARRWPPPDNT